MLQELAQAIRNLVRSEVAGIHTALTGQIVDYDPQKGTAVVKPYGYFPLNGKSVPYPTLYGLPVIFQQGASQSTSICFPVSEGDTCLIVLSECSIDMLMHRLSSGAELRHDLTNAICIPGLFAQAPRDAEEACKEAAVIVRSGETRLKVAQGGVTIEGSLTVTGKINSGK